MARGPLILLLAMALASSASATVPAESGCLPCAARQEGIHLAEADKMGSAKLAEKSQGMEARGNRPGDPESNPADDQTEEVADTVRLAPLSVVARFDPAAAAMVLDSAVRAPFRTRSLQDLLAATTGLNSKSYGPGQLATAGYRGGAARHTVIRWNGMRINSPMHGTVDLSTLPVAGLSGIRLDAGASAAGQVGGAPGGLLDLETVPEQQSSTWGSELLYGLGSFGEHQAESKFLYGGQKWQGQTLAGYTRADNDFPILHPGLPERPRMPDAALRRWYAQQDFAGNLANNRSWAVAMSGSGTNRQLVPALFASNQGESQEDRLGMASARLNGGSDAWRWYARAGWIGERILYQNQTAGIKSEGVAHSAEAGGGVQHAWNPHWSWSAAAFLRREAVRNSGYAAPAERWEQRFKASLIWDKGAYAARLDAIQDRYGGVWTPSQPAFHVAWKNATAHGTWVVRTGAARHYTRPALNDVLWAQGGNPALVPERGWTIDADAVQTVRKGSLTWEWQGLAWSSSIKDWIQWRPGENGLWEAQNLQQVDSRGLEIRLRVADQGRWHPSGEALYTYTHARPTDAAFLLYQADHRAILSAGVQRSFGAWRAGLTIRAAAMGKRPASTDGVFMLSPSLIPSLDATLSYTAPKWILGLDGSAENWTNHYYEAVRNRPMPGRSYRVNLRIRYRGKPRTTATPTSLTPPLPTQ